MIIVSITGPTMRDALAQVKDSVRYANMVEFRMDLIERASLDRLLSSTRKPTIVTCRPRWEGGKFAGSEEERALILRKARERGVAFVDLELNAGEAFANSVLGAGGTTKCILSLHLLKRGRINVQAVYRRLSRRNPDVMKFAYIAEDASELRAAIDFLTLAKADRHSAVAVAMGEGGEASRVLYRKFGGWATYASVEQGHASAPGQIPASQLKLLYHADRLRADTRVYGVIGNPLRQSKGVYVHNRMFGNANAVYCRFPVQHLGRFMRDVAPILSGFSVTLPHKETIPALLDRVDTATRLIGAVNTVIRRRGQLLGTNTDAPGALDAIEHVTSLQGRRMLILGAGGAARAIAFEARRRGATVFIANRTERRARQLAREFGLSFVAEEEIGQIPIDILVNATSVGMAPDPGETPLRSGPLKAAVVFDVVYNPPLTRFLREARKSGATIISGTEMYLNQAARQFRLFTGREPDVDRMRRILRLS